MKATKLLALTLITIMNLIQPACAKDDRGHTLTRLWAEYDKAVDADRPKDQADILGRIKKEAAEKHLAWDYYDATFKYVDARASSNWNLRDELLTQANQDIESFGEPVAVFFLRQGRSDTGELLRYVTEHKAQLEQAHNPEFYGRDGHVAGYVFSEFLLPRIANDYEYTLWSLFGSKKSEAVTQAIQACYAGRYPFDALIEFCLARRESNGPEDGLKKMGAFADAHAGQAVAILAATRCSPTGTASSAGRKIPPPRPTASWPSTARRSSPSARSSAATRRPSRNAPATPTTSLRR